MSLSTVTATVQDPSPQIFANGTWQLIFKPTFGVSGVFTDGGVPFTTIYGGNLDNTGSFSQAVNRNDTISPAGSRWTLIVAPNANGQAYQVDLNVNSGAFNASAAINAVITNVQVNASPLAHAYKDSEVIPTPNAGSLYYDNINKVVKVWDTANLAWLTIPTLGGSSTPVVTTPAGNQIIIQPISTSLFVNRFENIRYADRFSSISAAIADLGGLPGKVIIPVGTYTDNIVITQSVTLEGVDQDGCVINPLSTSSPVISIDGTSVGSIDGVRISNLTLPTPAGTASDGIRITGKQNSNEVTDHIILENIVIGSKFTVNTTGNGFANGLSITGRTIYSVFNKVICNGNKVNLNINETSGTPGPVNLNLFLSCQFNNAFNYGKSINTSASTNPSVAVSFINCEATANCQNTVLTPAAGILIQNVWGVNFYNQYTEANCPLSADANSAHLRITGNQVTPNGVSIFGWVFFYGASPAKFGILNDATASVGEYHNIQFFSGPAGTANVKLANTSIDSHIIIGSARNMGLPIIVPDTFGTTHVSIPAQNIYARKIINSAQYPLVANVFDLVSGGGATNADYGNATLGVTGGPVTINRITSGTKGQYLWLDSVSGAITLTQNSGGAGSFLMYDSTTRILQTNDAILFRHDGTNWQEVNLGMGLLGKAGNTWLQSQNFNGTLAKYNGLNTVAGGVPSELAQVDLTAQIASIGTTTLLAVPVPGQYRLSWNTKVTTAAGTSSSVNLTIIYTDPDGVVVTLTAAGINSTGAVATTPANSTTSTGALEGIPLMLNVKSGTNVQYSTTYASNAAATMQYNLHIKLELM